MAARPCLALVVVLVLVSACTGATKRPTVATRNPALVASPTAATPNPAVVASPTVGTPNPAVVASPTRAAPIASGGVPGTTFTVALEDRPFQLHLPRSYNAAKPVPLVVLLHGYSVDAATQEAYFKLTDESERRGFIYAMPDGTMAPDGNRFWNATTACCDIFGSGVDDSGYLDQLLHTVKSEYAVDASRVYFVGHSNGAFMAYRMACDHADEITAIVSLAGAVTDDPSQCAPKRPVSVLQIHGTADQTIPVAGGAINGHPYPSLDTTLATWRRLDGCTDLADHTAAPLDLDTGLPGAETTVTTYSSGCRNGTRVEWWSIKGGAHSPALGAGFAPAIMDFLYGQVSPGG
jgi:polyhydroxybutyrate depolymerase